MKTIGLIGGMSWESTTLYYQTINREVAKRRGGLRSAPMVIASLDFERIAGLQKTGDWDGMAAILGDAAQRLARGGADCLLIGTNTMHRIAPEVQAATPLPLIHIADVTAAAIRRQGLTRVGLLGTRFTMEQAFYVDRLAAHGIACLVPDEASRIETHRIIFEELCQGAVRDNSRAALREIIGSLRSQGAEGVILGCTELPLIVGAADSPIPVFDTTVLHALAAVDFCLGDD